MAVALTTIANQVVANLGLDSGQELAVQWAAQRYAELCARAKFRHLRQYGQLFIPSAVQSGTCTVTLNSPIVTLDAAGIAACAANEQLGWPDGFTGLFFRPQIGTTWYRISQARANGEIILETPFAYDNSYLVTTNTLVQTDVSFYIVQRYTALDPTARQLGQFMADFIMRPLRIISQDQMNMMVPGRLLVSTYPQFVAELNSNADETGYPKMVEIYPPPLNSVTIHYTYWQNPPILKRGDFLPPTIDPDVIRTGATIDAANNMFGKLMRAGKMEEAVTYRNIANQEATNFERKVQRAIKNDRGEDDVKYILRHGGWRMPLDWDPNTDAYSNFLLRGY